MHHTVPHIFSSTWCIYDCCVCTSQTIFSTKRILLGTPTQNQKKYFRSFFLEVKLLLAINSNSQKAKSAHKLLMLLPLVLVIYLQSDTYPQRGKKLCVYNFHVIVALHNSFFSIWPLFSHKSSRTSRRNRCEDK